MEKHKNQKRQKSAVQSEITESIVKKILRTTPTPKVDMYDKDDEIVVTAEIPGAVREKLKISIFDTKLRIKGEIIKQEDVDEKDYYYSEIAYGSFVRSLELPAKVVEHKVRAVLMDGILKICMPKIERSKHELIKNTKSTAIAGEVFKKMIMFRNIFNRPGECIHIIPEKNKWIVKSEGVRKEYGKYKTKEDAISFAESIKVDRNILIHNKNAEIENLEQILTNLKQV